VEGFLELDHGAYRGETEYPEALGPCRFQIDMVKRSQGGGTERECALHNEHQTTLIMAHTDIRGGEVRCRSL
jgi:hypothetical protein